MLHVAMMMIIFSTAEWALFSLYPPFCSHPMITPGFHNTSMWALFEVYYAARSGCMPGLPASVSGSILSHLQPYLVYRSALRTLERALKDVERIQDGQDLSSPMWTNFSAFLKFAS